MSLLATARDQAARGIFPAGWTAPLAGPPLPRHRGKSEDRRGREAGAGRRGDDRDRGPLRPPARRAARRRRGLPPGRPPLPRGRRAGEAPRPRRRRAGPRRRPRPPRGRRRGRPGLRPHPRRGAPRRPRPRPPPPALRLSQRRRLDRPPRRPRPRRHRAADVRRNPLCQRAPRGEALGAVLGGVRCHPLPLPGPSRSGSRGPV